MGFWETVIAAVAASCAVGLFGWVAKTAVAAIKKVVASFRNLVEEVANLVGEVAEIKTCIEKRDAEWSKFRKETVSSIKEHGTRLQALEQKAA